MVYYNIRNEFIERRAANTSKLLSQINAEGSLHLTLHRCYRSYNLYYRQISYSCFINGYVCYANHLRLYGSVGIDHRLSTCCKIQIT